MLKTLETESDADQRDGNLIQDSLADVAARRRFRLGMPHMGSDGVSRGWLLREACHVHWGAIAAHLGVKPTEFRDRTGLRVLPSVVACTVNGESGLFREDDHCSVFLSEHPCAQNGWRSQLELHSDRGCTLRVEIVTAFARRAGKSNQRLERANLGPEFQGARDGDAAKRASNLRRLGKSMRSLAEADLDPPHRTVEMEPVPHINGVGLVYFAAIHDLIEAAEHSALPELVRSWPMIDRRVHYFGNLDIGDSLELCARASVLGYSPEGRILVQNYAKRGSDGKVIATAESVYAT